MSAELQAVVSSTESHIPVSCGLCFQELDYKVVTVYHLRELSAASEPQFPVPGVCETPATSASPSLPADLGHLSVCTPQRNGCVQKQGPLLCSYPGWFQPVARARVLGLDYICLMGKGRSGF